jgi:hypothetical protein
MEVQVKRMYNSYSFTTSAGLLIRVMPQTRLTLGEYTPGTHCTFYWVGPREVLNTTVAGKIFCLCRGSNLVRPVIQSVYRHYTG